MENLRIYESSYNFRSKEKIEQVAAKKRKIEATDESSKRLATEGEKEFFRHRGGSEERTTAKKSKSENSYNLRSKGTIEQTTEGEKEVFRHPGGSNEGKKAVKNKKSGAEVADVLPIDEDTQRKLKNTIDKIKNNSEGVRQILVKDEIYSKVPKYDLEEINHLVQAASINSRKISQKLDSDDSAISIAKASKLEEYEHRIEEWHNYLHGTYAEHKEGLEKPKSTGIKEFHQATKVSKNRPTDASVLQVYSDRLRRVKAGEPLTPEDLHSVIKTEFGKYKRCSDRNDLTAIRDPFTNQRVGVMQINNGNSGVTIIAPVVGENGSLVDIWQHPYVAGVHIGHGNGIAPTASTIKSLGYTWGPFFLAHSNSTTETIGAFGEHFCKQNKKEDPKADWLWPQINGSQTAPPFVDYTHELSVITKEEILAAMQKGVTDKPVTYGNYNAGGGNANETAGFPAGAGGCAYEIPLRDKNGVEVKKRIAIYGHTNFGRRYLLQPDGVPLNKVFPETEIPGVLPEGRKEDRGSITVACITDISLSSHQANELAQLITDTYTTLGYTSKSSHDTAYVFSLGNRDSLPRPNYDSNIGSAFINREVLAEPHMNVVKALLQSMTKELLLTSLLASQDMNANGLIGKRMPHEDTLKAYFAHGAFEGRLPAGQTPNDYDNYLTESESETD